MPTEAERDRRWNLLDELCKTEGFDALILSANDYRGHKGSLRWVADYNLHHRSGHAVKIPGRAPTVMISGNMEGARRAEADWIDDYRFPASLGEGLVEVLREAPKVERVGVAGLGQIMKVDEYLALTEAFPAVEFVDATHAFDRVRQVKSAEEIRGSEESAYILDQAFTRLLEIARPGITEREIGAEMYREIYRLGGEDPLFLTMYHATFPDGKQHTTFGNPHERILRAHDVHTFSFEIIGPSGYWTEFARPVTFAPPSAAQRRIVTACFAGIDAAQSALVPGATPADVQRAVISAVESHGAKSVYWSGHSLGTDVLEDPWIGLDVVGDDSDAGEVTIGEHNVITIHPKLLDEEHAVSSYSSDVFVVEKDGARRLSEHPLAFFRIANGEVHLDS